MRSDEILAQVLDLLRGRTIMKGRRRSAMLISTAGDVKFSFLRYVVKIDGRWLSSLRIVEMIQQLSPRSRKQI